MRNALFRSSIERRAPFLDTNRPTTLYFAEQMGLVGAGNRCGRNRTPPNSGPQFTSKFCRAAAVRQPAGTTTSGTHLLDRQKSAPAFAGSARPAAARHCRTRIPAIGALKLIGRHKNYTAIPVHHPAPETGKRGLGPTMADSGNIRVLGPIASDSEFVSNAKPDHIRQPPGLSRLGAGSDPATRVAARRNYSIRVDEL